MKLKASLSGAANSYFAVLFISYSISQAIELINFGNSTHFVLFSIYLLFMTFIRSLSTIKSILVYGVLTFILMLFHLPLIERKDEIVAFFLWKAPINLYDLTLAYEATLFVLGVYNGLMGILVRCNYDISRFDIFKKYNQRYSS